MQAVHRAFMRRVLLLLAERFPRAGFTLHLGGRQLVEVRGGRVVPARAALTLAQVPSVAAISARHLPQTGASRLHLCQSCCGDRCGDSTQDG